MGKIVLVVGDICSDGSRYSYASSFVRGFKQLGYELKSFSPQRMAGISLISRVKKIYYRYRNQQAFEYALAVYQPDIVFVLKGNWLRPDTLASLKKKFSARFIHFYPDNPYTFWNGNSNAWVLEALPYWDHVLIWSKDLIEPLKQSGAKQVSFFPFAYDESIFYVRRQSLKSDTYVYDVVFIGTWDTDREWWLTQLKSAMPDLTLGIWGNGWQENLSEEAVLHRSLQGQAIYGEELVCILQRASIVLNFLRTQNKGAHNMRTFEVIAAGGFLLTERSRAQAHELFREGKNIACFGSLSELVAKISYFMMHTRERSRIIAQGRIAVKKYALYRQLSILVETIV